MVWQVRSATLAALLCAACTAGHRDKRAEDPAAEGNRRLAAAERAVAATGSAGAMAHAGWLRYLVASDLPGAQQLFEQALVVTARAAQRTSVADDRALALAGLAEVAEDRLDTLGAARAWAEILRLVPESPLAELAGARLLDVEGDSLSVDEVVAEAARQLAPPIDPRAARLVREAAARVAMRKDAAEQAPEPVRERAAWAALGAPQHWRVAGPVAALRRIDLAATLPLDHATEAGVPTMGPGGTTGERSLEFVDGDVGLDLETNDGDVYYAATLVSAARGGDYLAWVEGASALELRLDGAVLLSRNPYPRELPRAVQVPVKLLAGQHSLLVRWSRAEGSRFRVTLVRGDGAASDLNNEAPAALRGKRNQSACALGSTCLGPVAWEDGRGLRGFAERALQADPDDVLATYLLTRATLGDDRAAARAALERLLALTNSGAPALVLHAQALLRDTEVPDRLGRSRALGELTSAADKAPAAIRVRLSIASLQRDAERYDDAAAQLDKAERLLETFAPAEKKPDLPPRLSLARARLLDARGNTAAARAKVEAALAADAGRCDARALLYEYARRDGSLEEQARFAEAMLGCADGRSTLANVARERHDLDKSESLLMQLVAAFPAQPHRLEALGELLTARQRFDRAAAALRAAVALAPRSAEPHRRLSGLLETAGDLPGAKAERAIALQLTPGDLTLRRQVALDDRKPLLAWADRDAIAAARAPPRAGVAGTSAIRLLDLAGVEIFADGGAVERVHTLARVLDKKGITRFGEAHIPADAQVLRLRTIKPDGRVLEPESIPEKESVSLPGLEPGDAVEVDYLHALASRGPDLPGLTLGGFFFRDDETPMGESSYEVRAPAGVPLEVDAHQLSVEPPRVEGGVVRFHHSSREVQPLQPEPNAPGESETMPWVQVGSGAEQRDFIRSIADWALLRTRSGAAIDALAAAASGSSPAEKARNIYAALSRAVRGRSQGSEFGTPATHILALGRGNRLLVLKAALASAGIHSRLALARTFGGDPAPYRFPRGDTFNWALLRVELPGGPVWVDTAYRYAPFGRLPSFVRGSPAWLLPEPGEEPELAKTPDDSDPARDGRTLKMGLRMDATGAATGAGSDEHRGFEAASLKDALERMDRDQRKQAVEAMLNRGLRGVTLDSLSTEHEGDLGGSGTLQYALHAQLGRKEGSSLALPSSVLPARVGRRWVQKAERALPLLLDASDSQVVDVEVQLPQGFTLAEAPPPLKLETPFGSYAWSVREEPSDAGARKVLLHEELRLPQQRVRPEAYGAFKAFARAIDEAQSQDVRVTGPAGASATPAVRP